MSFVLCTESTFDVFHHGYFNFLSVLKETAKGGKIFAALNTDKFIFKYKRIVLVVKYLIRQEKLLNSKLVDQEIKNIGGLESKQSILTIAPDFIAIGSDWVTKNYYEQMNYIKKWLYNKKIGLIHIPYTSGISSSQLG